MGELVLENLDDEIKARLDAQAARHGRSVEEEVRAILRAAVGVRRLGVGCGIATRPENDRDRAGDASQAL